MFAEELSASLLGGSTSPLIGRTTTATLHGKYVTFHFVDGPDETYVMSELIRALAEFARRELRGGDRND